MPATTAHESCMTVYISKIKLTEAGLTISHYYMIHLNCLNNEQKNSTDEKKKYIYMYMITKQNTLYRDLLTSHLLPLTRFPIFLFL